MLREGELATLMEDVVRLAEQARDNHDVLIVEGLVPDADAQTTLRLNAEMAGSLSAELLLVLSGADRDARGIAECVQLVQSQFSADGNGKLAGLLLNRGTECGKLDALRAELAALAASRRCWAACLTTPSWTRRACWTWSARWA